MVVPAITSRGLFGGNPGGAHLVRAISTAVCSCAAVYIQPSSVHMRATIATVAPLGRGLWCRAATPEGSSSSPRAATECHRLRACRLSGLPDVHVVRMMDHVVQVIERNGPNCEFAAVTAQAAPSPVVTLEKGINICCRRGGVG